MVLVLGSTHSFALVINQQHSTKETRHASTYQVVLHRSGNLRSRHLPSHLEQSPDQDDHRLDQVDSPMMTNRLIIGLWLSLLICETYHTLTHYVFLSE